MKERKKVRINEKEETERNESEERASERRERERDRQTNKQTRTHTTHTQREGRERVATRNWSSVRAPSSLFNFSQRISMKKAQHIM